MKSTLSKIEIAKLIEDMSIYPRHAVDTQHVGALCDALESGAVLPPIVAEKRTLRVVDGWHRLRAYRRHIGAQGAIDVEVVDYADEAELIKDAIARNAQHGRRMDQTDRVRAVLMLKEHGVPYEQIAVVLNTTERRVNVIVEKTAAVPVSVARKETAVIGNTMPLKGSCHHLAGTRLSVTQATAHKTAHGVSYALLVRQLHDAVTCDLLNDEDTKLMENLESLHAAIGCYIDRHAQASMPGVH